MQPGMRLSSFVKKIRTTVAYGTAHVFQRDLAALGLIVIGDSGEALSTFGKVP